MQMIPQAKDDRFSIVDLAKAFVLYWLLGRVINSVHSCGMVPNAFASRIFELACVPSQPSEADLV